VFDVVVVPVVDVELVVLLELEPALEPPLDVLAVLAVAVVPVVVPLVLVVAVVDVWA
jgi:hypothetical protein